MNILNEECSFPGLEKTQDYNGGVSQSSETLLTNIENNPLLEWTLCFVSLQTLFMVNQQHYTLKKVQNVKKQESSKCKKA